MTYTSFQQDQCCNSKILRLVPSTARDKHHKHISRTVFKTSRQACAEVGCFPSEMYIVLVHKKSKICIWDAGAKIWFAFELQHHWYVSVSDMHTRVTWQQQVQELLSLPLTTKIQTTFLMLVNAIIDSLQKIKEPKLMDDRHAL